MEVSSTRIVNEMNNISCTFLWSNKYISLSLDLKIKDGYNCHLISLKSEHNNCKMHTMCFSLSKSNLLLFMKITITNKIYTCMYVYININVHSLSTKVLNTVK